MRLFVLVVLVGVTTTVVSARADRTDRANKSAVGRAQAEAPPGMVRIPGGTFEMGTKGGDVYERRVHTVTLSPYFIDRTEVTAAAYRQWKEPEHTVQWNNLKDAVRERESLPCTGGKPDRDNHPLNCVSWADAQAYCHSQGKRLPTEAEWQFAARGSDGRAYPWGNDVPEPQRLNACGLECRRAKKELLGWNDEPVLYEAEDPWAWTAPVGSHPAGASPFGVEDMAGNVSEWVSDWFDDYTSDPKRDPKGPVQGYGRVIRGGDWSNSRPHSIRADTRTSTDPEWRVHTVGFRCARSGVAK